MANDFNILDQGPVPLPSDAAAVGEVLIVSDDSPLTTEWAAPSGSAGPWEGVIHAAWGDGNPWSIESSYHNNGAATTPTNITSTVGRLVLFRTNSAITVNRIRYYGIGTVADLYTLAIYRQSDGVRLWTLDPANTTANTWSSTTTGLPITLAADTPYWLGFSAKGAGATAGFRTMVPPITGMFPEPMPGSLQAYGPRFASVTLTAGAWPDPLPTPIQAMGSWTGTIPIIFLDSDAAA